MKRRVLCFLMSAMLLVGAVFCTAPNAFAASNLKASEDIVALIKEFEGFNAFPHKDYSQYSVGYGSACKEGDYPDGITEEEADALLRADLVKHGTAVNRFADKYGLKLSQQQFDALVSFSYNLGSGWTTSTDSKTFRSAVVDGKTGNDFLFAIAQYSKAGGEILTGLVNRRLSEANVYLNGQYSKTVPANYKYVKYENVLEGVSPLVRVQGYDGSKGDVIRANPTKTGYTFLGWYTAENGGAPVTKLTGLSTGTTLYAHWQQGTGVDTDGKISGVPANYSYTAPCELPTYDAPNGKETGKINSGVTVTITADYMKNEVKWGKTSSGWIRMGKPAVQEADSSAKVVNMTVKTNSNGVRLRVAPGTTSRELSSLSFGKEVFITHVQEMDKKLWGRSSEGWLNLEYTNYDFLAYVASADPTKVTAVGEVIKVGSDGLNVRDNPGVSGTTVVDKYKLGDTVNITLQYSVNGTKWYKAPKGWISSDYVKLVSGSSSGETTPGETTPAGDKEVIGEGTVTGTDEVNVRNKPGTYKTEITGKYKLGEKFPLTGKKKVGNTYWYEAPKGWVSGYYLKVTAPSTTPTTPTTPGATTPGATSPSNPAPGSGYIATGVIDGCITLRVRTGPGTRYREVESLAAGTEVFIYEIQAGGGQAWGRIGASRWISLSYVDVEFIGYSTSSQRAVVTNCTRVNVRAGAGTSFPLIGKKDAKTKVYIIDQKIVKGERWYFTSAGWINGKYLEYVSADTPDETTPTTPGATTPGATTPGATTPGETTPTTPSVTKRQAGYVTGTSTLKVRSAPGSTNKAVGSLKSGSCVIITDTLKVGKALWGKIGEGRWISLFYVKIIADNVPANASIRTVTAENLKIRAAAGADQLSVGSYKKGAQVIVFETTQIGNATWGRTDKGWISLFYTK